MNLYLDSSALVKCFIAESSSSDVRELTLDSELAGTSLITRAETSAAFARLVRIGGISAESGRAAQRKFLAEWNKLLRVEINEALIARAETLAWEYSLRGYDAVQLASALALQDAIGRPVTLATYDRELWQACAPAGLTAWPAKLPR